MDPEEVMRLLRDAMIEISDLVGARLTSGGSVLSRNELETAVANAEKVVEHGQDLIEWLGKGGFSPVRD